MRFIMIAAVALILLAACGDDDSSSSTATPSLTPTEGAVAPGQLTPNADACTRDDVTGSLASTEGAAGHTFLTIVVGDAQRECTLTGPPEVRWYDADSAGLGTPFTPGADCEANETDYETCVYPDAVSLQPQDSSPAAGAASGVTAIVSVTNIDMLEPCASPNRLAHIIGLQFPDVVLDVQITLEQPIEMQFCSAQVDLVGYGPVGAGQN